MQLDSDSESSLVLPRGGAVGEGESRSKVRLLVKDES